MRVSWLSSLSTKLGILIVICLTAVVGVLTYKNSSWITAKLNDQFRDGTINRADVAASNIEGALERWLTLTSIAMHNAKSQNRQDFKRYLESYVGSTREFVSFEVFRANTDGAVSIADAFTNETEDVRFKSIDPTQFRLSLRAYNETWIKTLVGQGLSNRLYLGSLLEVSDLPMINIAVPFAVEGKAYIDWAVLTVWSTNLLRTMDANKILTSFIIDDSRNVLISQQKDLLGKPAPKSYTPLLGMLDKSLATRYRYFELAPDYPVYGALKRVGETGLIAVVSRDARPALAMIRGHTRTALEWAAFFLLLFGGIGYMLSITVTRKLANATIATQRIAAGDFSVQLKDKSPDEVGVLSRAVNNMSFQIQSLLHARVEAARQEKELETARIVQNTLFPKDDIHSEMLHIYGHCRAASECGGDWWGYFTTDDGKEYVLVADATGHGAPAALVTAMAYAGYRTLGELLGTKLGVNRTPGELLEVVNRVLWEAGRGTTTMTCFAAMIDPKSGEMCFANAGHNVPILVPKSHNDDRLTSKRKNQRHMNLNSRGNPLGIMSNSKFQEHSFQLRAGDKIVMYTDGIIECTNAAGEAWGSRVFKKMLERFADSTAIEVKNGLFQEALNFFAGHPANDDITVVVAEVDAGWRADKDRNVA